ncbi:hypothetical protein [Roseovarius dicentrarchi]|uniref:hypothetical protein n=1 Tax=Roseovarius dicentrarchi TaxID=2250573 RepID=UPI0019397B01|nr:hypothetical protein [Roseovarius dicentrarchi]
MLHEAKRPLSGAKPIPRIFLGMRNFVTHEMVSGNHSKVSETANISQRTLLAEVEDWHGKLNPQSFPTTAVALLLVAPVDRQKHVGLGTGETTGRQSALRVAEICTSGRLSSEIKRIRMLDPICFLELLGKAFHPDEGGRSKSIDQHSYLPA